MYLNLGSSTLRKLIIMPKSEQLGWSVTVLTYPHIAFPPFKRHYGTILRKVYYSIVLNEEKNYRSSRPGKQNFFCRTIKKKNRINLLVTVDTQSLTNVCNNITAYKAANNYFTSTINLRLPEQFFVIRLPKGVITTLPTFSLKMILVPVDRYRPHLSVGTKNVPVALYLRSRKIHP